MPFVKDDPLINRKGRPVGSVSIKSNIKRYYKEHPEEFEDLCKYYRTNEDMRELLWKYLDGMPTAEVNINVWSEIANKIYDEDVQIESSEDKEILELEAEPLATISEPKRSEVQDNNGGQKVGENNVCSERGSDDKGIFLA